LKGEQLAARTPKKSLIAHGGDVAFIAVTVAGYLAWFAQLRPPLNLPVVTFSVVAGFIFAAVGTQWFNRISQTPKLPYSILYLLFQLTLVTAVTFLNQPYGSFWLLLLPLTSHGIVLLSQGAAAGFCLLEVGYFIGTLVLFGVSPLVALQNGVTFAAGVVFVALFTQITLNEERARHEVERLAAALAEANQKLSAYAVQAEELATAKERNRLAREIHDSLGHYLTAINIQLEAARALLGTESAPVRAAVEKAQTLTKEGLAEVRRSVAALRASPLEGRALPTVLDELVQECESAGLTTRFTVTGAPHPLPPPVELTLFRTVQEGLTNIRKHAQATQVTVALDYAETAVQLTIQDNGVGVAELDESGFGLVGLRERVALLGGQVQITTGAGQGFTLFVSLPLNHPSTGAGLNNGTQSCVDDV